jgi:hypothetical protein
LIVKITGRETDKSSEVFVLVIVNDLESSFGVNDKVVGFKLNEALTNPKIKIAKINNENILSFILCCNSSVTLVYKLFGKFKFFEKIIKIKINIRFIIFIS